MSIKIGSISAKDIYIGSTPAKEIRLGSTLIWSRSVEPEEIYYTLTLNGVDSEGIESYYVYINGEHQTDKDVYQIPKGSFVQVLVNPKTEYNYSFSSNIGSEADAGDGWYMDQDVIITVTTSKHYTLTLNLDGDYEAFDQDGYTILVNGETFARTATSKIYSIPGGAVVKTHNNSMNTEGYEYSETITPTPSYNEDGSWIMDQDYTINIIAINTNPKITINMDHDYIDRVYIWYKLPETEEYEWTFAQLQNTFPIGTQFYLQYSPIQGYEINWSISTDPGSIDNPYYLDEDMTFNVHGTGSPYRYLTIEAINSITGYPVIVDRLTVKENGVTIYDETDSYGVDNLQINYGCSVTIEYDSPLFGDIEPAGYWDSFEEDAIVTISLSSN